MKDFVEEQEEREAQEKRHEFLRNSALNDVRKVLSIPEGRRFIKYLFRVSPLFDECYRKNADTYYLLGRQSVSREIYMLLVEADPAFCVPPVFQEDTNVELT